MVFPEPLDDHDRHTVYIKKDDVIIGHAPREQAMRPVDGSLNSCHEITLYQYTSRLSKCHFLHTCKTHAIMIINARFY